MPHPHPDSTTDLLDTAARMRTAVEGVVTGVPIWSG